MATYTININERTKTGKNLIEFLKTLKGVVSIKSVSGLDEAMDDVRAGNVYKAKDSKDLFKKCLS